MWSLCAGFIPGLGSHILMCMKCNSARYLDLGACYKEPQAGSALIPHFITHGAVSGTPQLFFFFFECVPSVSLYNGEFRILDMAVQ